MACSVELGDLDVEQDLARTGDDDAVDDGDIPPIIPPPPPPIPPPPPSAAAAHRRPPPPIHRPMPPAAPPAPRWRRPPLDRTTACTTWRMSAIILESGTWPSRMICGPTWRTLTWAPGNAWLIAILQLLRVERDADQERDGPVGLIPERQAGRAERLAEDVQEPAVGLIAEDFHVGDARVRDHDPGQGPPGLDDLGFARRPRRSRPRAP